MSLLTCESCGRHRCGAVQSRTDPTKTMCTTIAQGRTALSVVSKSLEAEREALRVRWLAVCDALRGALAGLPDCESGHLALVDGSLTWYGGGLEPVWHYPASVCELLAAIPGLMDAARTAGLGRLAVTADALAACDAILRK